MAEQPGLETKPQVTIGALGDQGHGKSSLAAAISRVLSDYNGSKAKSYHNSGIHIDFAEREYATDFRRYMHIDCKTHFDILKNLIVTWTPTEGAILVVSATEGITSRTREQVRLARQVGAPAIVVFVNKCDLVENAERFEVVEQEVKALLRTHDFSADSPILWGSATRALESTDTGRSDLWNGRIWELLDALDTTIPTPIPDNDKPFLMTIEEVFFINGRMLTIATGYVERGRLKINQPVEVVGLGPTRQTIATDLEQCHRKCEIISSGYRAGMLLRGMKKSDLERGQVVAAPGTIKPYTRFRAEFSLFTHEGDPREIAFGQAYGIFLHGADIQGCLLQPEGIGI